MTEPIPGAPIPASSQEGYTIRIPPIRQVLMQAVTAPARSIAGNSPHLVTAAVGVAVGWVVYMRLHGQPVDFAMIPQVVDTLTSNGGFLLIAPMIAAAVSFVHGALKKIAAKNHNQQLLAITALAETIVAKVPPVGAEQAGAPALDPAEIKRFLEIMRALSAAPNTPQPTKGDQP